MNIMAVPPQQQSRPSENRVPRFVLPMMAREQETAELDIRDIESNIESPSPDLEKLLKVVPALR